VDLFRDGHLVTHSNEHPAIYVIDKHGNMYVWDGPPGGMRPGDMHHSSLGANGVYIAGEIIIRNGIVEKVNRVSGHYEPRGFHLGRAREVMNELGINVRGARFPKGEKR
jgi:hypothetical protein